MKKIYTYQDSGGAAIERFLQSLPSKQQERLLRQIAMLLLPQLGKPPVKHFQMDKYRSLFELRDKYKTTLSIPGGFTPLFRRLETIVPI